MVYGEPFTHTGVLGTYTVDCNLEVYAGWTLGIDTGFDQFADGSNFPGGAKYSLLDNASLAYLLEAGDLGKPGSGYTHSVVLDVDITCQWNYVLQSDPVQLEDDDRVSINQYLFYDLSDHLALGTRVEWFKFNGTSFYGATFGANWKPHSNFVLRPEIRQDWQPSGDWNKTIFGIDGYVTF
jgi:hypothetical protein